MLMLIVAVCCILQLLVSYMSCRSSINPKLYVAACLFVCLHHAKTDGVQQQTCMYNADPVTTAWLKSSMDSVFGYPDLVRFSWQTTTRLLEDTACAVHWYCLHSFVQLYSTAHVRVAVVQWFFCTNGLLQVTKQTCACLAAFRQPLHSSDMQQIDAFLKCVDGLDLWDYNGMCVAGRMKQKILGS